MVAINRGSEEMHAWVDTGRVDVVVFGEVAHSSSCEVSCIVVPDQTRPDKIKLCVSRLVGRTA